MRKLLLAALVVALTLALAVPAFAAYTVNPHGDHTGGIGGEGEWTGGGGGTYDPVSANFAGGSGGPDNVGEPGGYGGKCVWTVINPETFGGYYTCVGNYPH